MSAQPARPVPIAGSKRSCHALSAAPGASIAGPPRRGHLWRGSRSAHRLGASLSAWLLLELAAASLALAQVQVGVLQCRLASGPWQPCRMEIQDIGLHWVLRIGEQRIEFRHSGDGSVRMQKGAGPWQPVTASWQPDTSLCWDGVCAKGDIPLD